MILFGLLNCLYGNEVAATIPVDTANADHATIVCTALTFDEFSFCLIDAEDNGKDDDEEDEGDESDCNVGSSLFVILDGMNAPLLK